MIAGWCEPECSNEVLKELMRVVQTSKYALTQPTGEPIGTIFHPLPAFINHDCNPNSYLRFDMSQHYHHLSCPNPVLGSMSVHAARDIAEGEEVTDSYMPLNQSTETRRAALQSSHYFKCMCGRCTTAGPSVMYSKHETEALSLTNAILAACPLPKGGSVELVDFHNILRDPKTRAAAVCISLAALSGIGFAVEEAPYISMRIEFSRMLQLANAAAQSRYNLRISRSTLEEIIIQHLVLTEILQEKSFGGSESDELRAQGKWRLIN